MSRVLLGETVSTASVAAFGPSFVIVPEMVPEEPTSRSSDTPSSENSCWLSGVTPNVAGPSWAASPSESS